MNDQLVERIKQCQTLPSLPAVAIQVLELAQKTDVDIAEIARIISRDPALSTRILKTVNSSFYARSQNVSTISHALVILGLQSVKTLVLGFSLVSNLTKTRGKGFQHLVYWKRSVHAATAAKVIAGKIGLVQHEEAFLVALLMDLGMLVLDQVVGAQYGEINARVESHEDLAAQELTALGMTHGDVGGILTAQWKLPPVLTTPIAFHASPDKVTDPALRRLTDLVHLAGRCADVFVDAKPAPAIAAVRQLFMTQHAISEADCDGLLEMIGQRAREVASLFEIQIGAAVQYDAILKKANEALVEITLQSQQVVTELSAKNQQLSRDATTDALTGLANRGAFDKFLAEQFALARAQQKPLSLLLLDVDKFKSVNDQHGHQAGDSVLKILGKIMSAAARKQDLAARYGGEEICLILPGTNRATAAMTAERIRAAIAARPLPIGKQKLSITASIGVACADQGGPFTHPSQLLKAADLAIYAAKHAGRNCVKVFAIAKPAA